MEQSFMPHALGLVTLITFSFIGSISPNMVAENVNSDDFSSFYEYDRSLPLNAAEELLADEDTYQVYEIYFDSVNSERVPAVMCIPIELRPTATIIGDVFKRTEKTRPKTWIIEKT